MIQFLISALCFFHISFYSLSFSTSEQASISMNAFTGKKVLILNIATSSKWASQLGELEQLQQKFKDSLVIIAFPSNSFGNEQRSDGDILNFCRDTYNTSFLIASKSVVKGDGLNNIYNWLGSQSENGSMQGEVSGDFQKFLIDENGRIVGVFASNVSPLDFKIRDAIDTNYN